MYIDIITNKSIMARRSALTGYDEEGPPRRWGRKLMGSRFESQRLFNLNQSFLNLFEVNVKDETIVL